jgi:ankyrin repeat protein
LNINEFIPEKLKRSALMLAALQGSTETIQLILERYDLLIDRLDSKGHSALSLTAYSRYEEIVKMIIDYPADLDTMECSGGRSALTLAAEQNRSGVGELLPLHGVDPAQQDSQGRAPLTRAV